MIIISLKYDKNISKRHDIEKYFFIFRLCFCIRAIMYSSMEKRRGIMGQIIMLHEISGLMGKNLFEFDMIAKKTPF